MTLFTIECEKSDFGSLRSYGFEIGTWYVLVSWGRYSWELTFKKGERR